MRRTARTRRTALDRRGARRARLMLLAIGGLGLLVVVAVVVAFVVRKSAPQATAPNPVASRHTTPSATNHPQPTASPAPAVPAQLKSALAKFLGAYYTRAAGEQDSRRTSRIRALVPATTWQALNTLVPGIPADAPMSVTADYARLQAQAPSTPGELYVTVPVTVSSPGSPQQSFRTASLWQRSPSGWTLLQFAAGSSP